MIENNKRKFDLFISDFDSTLGTAPDIISPENVKAMQQYINEGGIFAICTGRMFSSIRPICIKYGLKGLVISYQGSMINDIESGECLFQGGLTVEDASKVAQYLLDKNITVLADIDDVMYIHAVDEFAEHYQKACKVDGVYTQDLVGKIKELNVEVTKVGALCMPDVAYSSAKEINEIFGGDIVANNGAKYITEVVNKNFDKKFAVEFLADYYKIPYERIITVGDSTNDLGLMNGDWHGVAVGDASPELKRVAKEVTVPFKEHAIKVLLEKYCIDSND